MIGRRVRPVAAVASVLVLAAAGIALQPERGGGAGQPQGQPAGQPAERGGGGGGGARGPQASVEGGMRGMNRALRQLNQQIGDAAKRDENLRLLNDMQRGCVTSKGAAIPEKYLEGKDEAGKAKVADDFRRDLIKTLRLLLDIETAVADGKADEAKTKLAELGKLRDEGHELMGIKD